MAARQGKETFASFLRKKRIEKKIGLRQFAKIIDMQPSNYCNIEGEASQAPQEDKLKLIAEKLGLDKEDQRTFFDLASKAKDDIPADIQELIKGNALIPSLLRTVEDEDVDEAQILAIVEDIKSGKYRSSTT